MMRWVLLVAMGVATFASFWAPDAVGFQNPGLARIIFFHLPCAIAGSLFFFASAYHSVAYLRTREPVRDIRAVASIEMGFVLGCLTMVTGILFSKVQWGAWWSWDPRQTSFLIVLMMYSGYFALRASFSDDAMRAKVGAAYSAFSLLPALFLTFVYPRLSQVLQKSLHPTQTVVEGQLDPTYRTILYSILALLLCISVWIYRLNVRAGILELNLQNDGYDEARGGDPALTGVVRPVSLSEES